ncbi:MAG: hypothetical protein RL523_1082 [Actinomycetota bacterium]
MNAEFALNGPYDSSDPTAPVELAVFGSISFVPSPLVTVRAEVEEGTGRIVALTFDYKESTLQVQAFASSKGESIWESVLEDISGSLSDQGISVQRQIGPFGTELLAEIPVTKEKPKAVRMFAASGDRWLLRATMSGRALLEIEPRTFLEDFFKGFVVNRGELPLPPRELLPLELPSGAIAPKGTF